MNNNQNQENEQKFKNAKSQKSSQVFGFTRQVLDDVQGLPLLLLYLFDEILDDVHDVCSECVWA